MTTVIAARPQFWLILGSNTESTNASSVVFFKLFLYRINLQFMKNLIVFNHFLHPFNVNKGSLY